MLVVQGEPGVGKSRLAWEFEKYVDGLTATVRWHRGRCLSYGEGVAFWALAEAVRGRLGLVDADWDPYLVDQLDEAWLRPWVPTTTSAPGCGPRIGCAHGATETHEPASKDELFSAWMTFFERVGGGEPVVLVVDDVQYADDALLDFFEHLLVHGALPDVRAAPRPHRARGAAAQPRDQPARHRPPPRPARPTTTWACSSTASSAGSPAECAAPLVASAEGRPALRRRDRPLAHRPRPGGPVGGPVRPGGRRRGRPERRRRPGLLQALVAARLDALSADERTVVSDASVLGLHFTVEGIAVARWGRTSTSTPCSPRWWASRSCRCSPTGSRRVRAVPVRAGGRAPGVVRDALPPRPQGPAPRGGRLARDAAGPRRRRRGDRRAALPRRRRRLRHGRRRRARPHGPGQRDARTGRGAGRGARLDG